MPEIIGCSSPRIDGTAQWCCKVWLNHPSSAWPVRLLDAVLELIGTKRYGFVHSLDDIAAQLQELPAILEWPVEASDGFAVGVEENESGGNLYPVNEGKFDLF